MGWTLGILWGCALWGLLPLVHAQAQDAPPSVTLGWDYGPEAIERFVLERKTGLGGTYAALPLLLPATARQAVDTPLPTGQLFCWRVRAVLGAVLSLPSNEVCGAVLLAPTLLRIQ
jgi:hypothetical protein